MTDRELPDGVPSDNTRADYAGKPAGPDGAFQAPDMATPQFAAPRQDAKKSAAALPTDQSFQPGHSRGDEDDEEIISMPSVGGRNVLLYLAIAVLFTALLAIIYVYNKPGLPLCPISRNGTSITAVRANPPPRLLLPDLRRVRALFCDHASRKAQVLEDLQVLARLRHHAVVGGHNE